MLPGVSLRQESARQRAPGRRRHIDGRRTLGFALLPLLSLLALSAGCGSGKVTVSYGATASGSPRPGLLASSPTPPADTQQASLTSPAGAAEEAPAATPEPTSTPRPAATVAQPAAAVAAPTSPPPPPPTSPPPPEASGPAVARIEDQAHSTTISPGDIVYAYVEGFPPGTPLSFRASFDQFGPYDLPPKQPILADAGGRAATGALGPIPPKLQLCLLALQNGLYIKAGSYTLSVTVSGGGKTATATATLVFPAPSCGLVPGATPSR